MAFVLGVDEAGRGPLAGPVALGVVCVPTGLDVAREFPGVKDSKQLSERAREKIFEMLEARTARGDVRFCVRYGSHGAIDARGMRRVVRVAIARGVRALAREIENKVQPWGPDYKVEPCFHILLDGLLTAPQEYPQETVIKGDALVPVISLASIAAKVSRDRLMKRLAGRYPLYGFERHKGYPTTAHYEALARYGPSPIHRLSYLHVKGPVGAVPVA